MDIDDLIEFGRNEPQSLQDMVEMFLLMDDNDLEIFDRAWVGLAAARLEAGRLMKRRTVH